MSASRGAQGPGHGGPTCPGQLASAARPRHGYRLTQLPPGFPPLGRRRLPRGGGRRARTGQGSFGFLSTLLGYRLSRTRCPEAPEENDTRSRPCPRQRRGAVRWGERAGRPPGVCSERHRLGGRVCTAVLLCNGEITEHRGTCRRHYYSATFATPAARSDATGVFLRLCCNSLLPCQVCSYRRSPAQGPVGPGVCRAPVDLGLPALRLE